MKRRRCDLHPTQRTITLKRRVGYGEYVDREETSEHMEVDKHVERRQKLDWLVCIVVLYTQGSIDCRIVHNNIENFEREWI
jgi:hypothetical protein